MTTFKNCALLFITVLFLATSCQEEEMIRIENTDSENNAITVASKAAELISRTTTKDGSDDNILDMANCLSVSLPATVIVNGTELTINTEDDYDLIEDIFDEFDDDEDNVELIFPVEFILSDFSVIIITNEDDLEDLIEDCNGENEGDEDLECIDFNYPLSAEIFNSLTESTGNITIDDDKELYELIEDLENNEVLTLGFPISLTLADGSVVEANDLDTLEDLLEESEDDCDEDDDFDFDDDDCINCTTSQLADILLGCSGWVVDKLERNDNDLEDNFDDFVFNFSNGGTITVNDGSNNFSGTWQADGEGENITVVINVPGFEEELNGTWDLHEIEDESGEKKVDLRMSNKDRLRFESECN